MEEIQPTTSSTPQMMPFGNTPTRRIVCQQISTPLRNINENDLQDKDRIKTPVINPFEVKADSLYFPSCSPSVFATLARNKTNNGQFRWSIDHVSLLYPADIDETSVPEIRVDPEHEKKAQEAIDAFFSQSSIVPSPWSSESDRREAKIRRATRKSSMFSLTSDVGVQTMVTVPPDVDLGALLGEQYIYNEENETAHSTSPTSSNSSLRDSDVMSTSSLRRKLFAADDGCETPSRLERKDLYLAKQWSTPTINMRSMQSTPSDLLASSPITPPLCSEQCSIRASPQMSPIAGPSSNRSMRMRSFNERLDEESNSQLISKLSSHNNHERSETSMSFSMDSQDTGTFQSYTSEKQDTGYVTGSMFSLQNVTSDTTTSGFQSRITPVTELLDDAGFDNAVSNMSCTSDNNMSLDYENLKSKHIDSVLLKSEKWSLLPNSCSTPAFDCT